MSIDETDSLVRAVAAAPAMPVPVRAVSVLLVDAAQAVARVRGVAEPFGGKLLVRPDGLVQLVLVGGDGAAQAASCALAVRAAVRKARLAIASGPSEAATIERAVVLLQGVAASRIAIDDATAERLDARFEVHGLPSAPSLVAPRKSGEGPHIGPDVLNDALEAERQAGGIAGHPMRLAGSGAMLVAVAVAYLVHPNPTRWVLLILLGPYVVYAATVILALNVLRVPQPKWFMPIFVDILFFGVIAIAVSRVAPADATWAVGLTTTLCCMHMVGACISFRPVRVAVATVLALVVVAVANVVARQPLVSLVLSLAVLMTTSSMARHLMRRVLSLVARVAEEAETRVSEVEVLNAELRRQIADRAEQLANALARLETRSPPRALHAGMILEERYRIVRAIGQGGMGAVYEVERIADGRKLALKVLTGAADRISLARFAREAQIAAALNHANVVSVVDVDVTRSGMLFVVMELVAGGSLASERRRYGDATWAVPILRQIATALTVMHARGIIHRDLKPSNILLDGSTVKVADFGIVAVLDRAPLAETQATATVSAAVSPALTGTGSILGTPLYMAPELARGAREASPSSDMFSLGVLAYEILANELPHVVPPVHARLDGRAAPVAKSLAHTRPDLARELCALVDRCLTVEPEARPTADALVAALERVAP